MYHLRQGYSDIAQMPVYERKWIIDRFIEQKNKEEEQINKSQGKQVPHKLPPQLANLPKP